MFRLGRPAQLPIGLDLGNDTVKLLQAKAVGQTLSLRAAVRRELPAEARASVAARVASAAGMLREMLDEGDFAGRRVVAAVPREFVHIKNFRLPQMPLADLEGAVPLEARNLFPFDVEKAQVRFLPAGDVRQGNDVLQEIIVLAVRDDDLDAFVEQLHRAGVVPCGIDFAPQALYRCVERFMRRREDETEVNVLVDIGLRSTQVVIGRGRDISFVKTIDLGGVHLQEAVSRKLSISVEEAKGLRRRFAESKSVGDSREANRDANRDPVRQAASDAVRGTIEHLAREIALCLRYHSVTFRGQRPTRVRVYGGECGDPQIQAVFNSVLTLPVDSGRPLFNVDTAEVPEIDPLASGSWALALGLCLKGTAGRFAAKDGKTREALAALRVQAAEAADQGPPLPTENAPADGAPASTSSAPAAQEAAHA